MPYGYPDSSFCCVTEETCKFAALGAADHQLSQKLGRSLLATGPLASAARASSTGIWHTGGCSHEKLPSLTLREKNICGKLLIAAEQIILA
jgi:hypothetical protein